MASAQKISELTTAGPLTGAELVPVVQNGGTLQTTVSAIKVFSLGNVVAEVSALDARVEAVSALATQNATAIASVQTDLGDLTTRVANVSSSVSVLNVQMVAAQASISALNVALAAIDASVIQSRLDAVSAATSVNAASITSVNAVLATKVNRVGDYMDEVQYIEFNTSTAVSSSAGRISWNIDEGTMDVGFDNQGVVLHSGLQLYERLYNNGYSTLAKGTVVRITGSQGQRLTAAPALADSDADSASTFAVMAETVSVNNSGFAVVQGILKNVNTNGIADGTTLWLSPTSAGEFTPVKPVAPEHLVLVGYVVKGNSTGGGSIYVKIINGFELGELHDVKISASSSLTNNEVLAYNTSAGVWTNSTVLLEAQSSISALDVRVAAVSASVSVLNVQMQAVQASISAINSTLATIDVSALTALEPRVSALEVRVAGVSASVSALQVQLNAVSAALTSTNNVVSALEIRVSAASATGATNAAAITSINNVVSALDIRVAAVSASVSSLNIRLDTVSALVSTNAAAITSINNAVSVLEIRVSSVSAANATNAAAITSINNVVSALEVRVSSVSAAVVSVGSVAANVSALVSALDIRVAAVSASVSALQVQLNNVSAALTSTNNVVSALEIRVSAASAIGATNSAAITSINNVVSALEIRVSNASAAIVSTNTVVANVSALVSTVDVRVAAVSASVSAINARLPVGTVVGTTDTQTLTNKRINPRSFVTTTGVSLTPDISQFDFYAFTALAADISVNPPTGTPVNGNKLILRFKDNGVSRTITWTVAGANSYRAVNVSLPASTSVSKVTYVGCMYNADETFWDVLAVATQV